MSLTINSFEDLLYIVNTHPEWRHALVKALFPEIDLPKTLQETWQQITKVSEQIARLAVSYEHLDGRTSHLETDVTELKADVKELKTDVAELKTDVAELKTDVAELKTDVAELKTDVAELKTDVAELKTDVAELKTDSAGLKTDVAGLKGFTHEINHRLKAASIFGRYIKRGRDVTSEVADQLQAAQESGQISAQEFDRVMAADLLFGGRLRQAEGDVILVIEASWTAQSSDVERAVERAGILRRVGLTALPVVAAQQWPPEVSEQGRTQHVVMVADGMLDEISWQEALSTVTGPAGGH